MSSAGSLERPDLEEKGERNAGATRAQPLDTRPDKAGESLPYLELKRAPHELRPALRKQPIEGGMAVRVPKGDR